MRKAFAWLRDRYPLLVVILAFAWSALAIASYRRQAVPPGVTKVIRIGHWQLEAGVREAFDRMAEEYRKVHPEVLVVQDAIPESSYGQWMTTQLMGGTAPDLLEVGVGVPGNVLLGFHNRYFMPMSSYINQPNPYNKGTELEAEPWRKTFKDGMRTGYIEELQETMMVPLSQFGVRIFYNRTLFRRLTGLEEPPKDFRAFMAACETIGRQVDGKGRPYVPIASSAYHVSNWDALLCAPLTFGAIRRTDFNRDGTVGSDEFFTAVKTDRIDFDHPAYEARFRMLMSLARHFQSGFTGLMRDDAVFLFAQQRAVFITTGTWDAGSLETQARGQFELGIMGFPLPAPDDPEFGPVMEGPIYEKPIIGFPFVITRSSRHPEVALDFLRFVSSQRNNEELNRIIGWIPSVRGTRMSALMSRFEPNLEGMYSVMNPTLGGETIIKWQQLFAELQIGMKRYPDMIGEYKPFYLDKGRAELDEINRNRTRGLIRDEQFLAGYRARMQAAEGAERTSREIKLRQLTTGRLIGRDLGVSALMRKLDAGAAPEAIPPYALTPAALERVRARLAAEGKEGKAP